MKSLVIVALFCYFAAVFAAPADKVRWCVKSEQEYQKCKKLEAKMPVFSCMQAINTMDCITAIAGGNADAITLDGGDVYTAGLHPHNLHPIMAEDYGSDSSSCYYAVAVVKKGNTFGLRDLQNKKSCHTGVGKSAGWNIPVGTLVSQDILKWNGMEDSPIEEAVSNFFQASCAPGAKSNYPKLCQLCKKDCSRSHSEPYYDYAGAFKCLEDGAGDVAFVKHLTVPDSVKADYELLCLDNSRAPIDSYKSCNLAKVPAHAVVSRKDPQMTERIWTSLEAAQSLSGFKLFSSSDYPTAKNLMFKDSTVQLVRLSTVTDSFLYLGAKYISIVRALNKENNVAAASSAVKWCAVGGPEKDKCDLWSTASFTDRDVLECQAAPTVKDCLKKILRGEADAIAVDGGEVFTAGKCGLVPAMVEQYDQSQCNSPGAPASSYYAVAVVKKGTGLTWDKLKGKKSCHTGLGRTAGWNIPMGLIHKETNDCDFTKFFSSGCAPGSEPGSPFCTQCAGSNADVGDPFKCKASSEERYYGYAGAFRCLVEGGGDVAFIKHTIVSENSDGIGPEWAKNVKAEDYELICPGKGPVPVTEYAACNLAVVPAHAVVTRPDVRNKVVDFLQQQQAKNDDNFNMFQSGQNLLFKDSTKCLQEIPAGQTYQQFLGAGYMTAMTSLRQCTDSASDLEKACSFLSCQQTN